MELSNQVAVITGGSSGIGAAIADALSTAGAKPVVWDRAPQADVVCDVTEPAQVNDAMRRTIDIAGVPSILVASAGIVAGSELLDLDLDEWDRVLSVNLRGALICMKEFAACLVDAGRGGSVLAVSSVNSTVVDAGLAAYSASKAALNMVVRIAAVEWGSLGIRVNAIGPGVTETPMVRFTSDPGYLRNLRARTPLGDVGKPGQIAEAALNLIRSDWVTGQVVMVDGGASLMTARSVWWGSRNQFGPLGTDDDPIDDPR